MLSRRGHIWERVVGLTGMLIYFYLFSFSDSHDRDDQTKQLFDAKNMVVSIFAGILSALRRVIARSVLLKMVLIPIGHHIEEMEVVMTLNVMHQASVDVVPVLVEPQLEVELSNDIITDKSIFECFHQVFVFVAGGMPTGVCLRDCKALEAITKKQAEEKRVCGVVGATLVVVLSPWGHLKKKETTCYPTIMDKLPILHVVKTNLRVFGELTSCGPDNWFEFFASLAEQRFGESIPMYMGKLLSRGTEGSQGVLEYVKGLGTILRETSACSLFVAASFSAVCLYACETAVGCSS